MGEQIKVAVRVRPFNDRERQRNATLVIEMDAKTTGIRDPANMRAAPKTFTYDHSYWSHDGYKERDDGYFEPTDSKYADQKRVFDDLGRGVLENAWQGYNCSLFAYGQTGSGKSYSMVGFGGNKGIIPQVCELLFQQIDERQKADNEYQVSVSMFEIYCERIRDLLTDKPPPKGGLKVRNHPKKGFYGVIQILAVMRSGQKIEDLRVAPVRDYAAIEAKMNEGNRNRTIAATNMNATSSRAHTIFQINFTQKSKSANTTKTSLINLVDLAGSERQEATGAEGQRLKEGIVINQSLSTLGRCIKALHEQQKGAKGQVPYRDSVLTSLLKNALGGNSKTIMIAALSPADINYDETLSTLRFADRAKSIKTRAVVNESATDRLIRELREENQRLQHMLKSGGIPMDGSMGGGEGGAADPEELQALREQLEANRKEMEAMEKTWQERMDDEAKLRGPEAVAQAAELRKSMAHLWNLNEDPALTDKVVHFLSTGESKIGNKDAQPPADIVLAGLSIEKEHATVRNRDHKKISIEPFSGVSILVNGKEISGETELRHNDRVLLGGNHLYVFAHPHAKKKDAKQTVTWDMAQAEIAQNSGLLLSAGAGRTKEDMILQEELIQLMPQVYRANAMAAALRTHTKFEIALVAPQARGLKSGATEIFVKVRNLAEDTEFLWDRNKFVNRYYGMQEMYQNFSEGASDWQVSKDHDPFYEPASSEQLVGSVHVYLRSLAYMVELDEQLPVADFRGAEVGQLRVALAPCTPNGKEITGEFVESPDELVGKNLSFKVKIKNAIGLPRKFTTTCCKYKFYLEDKPNATKEVAGSAPDYGHEKTFQFKPVTKQLVDHLQHEALYVEVYGRQAPKDDRSKNAAGGLLSTTYNPGAPANDVQHLQAKLDKIQSMIDDALATDKKQVPVKDVQRALAAASARRAKSAHSDASERHRRRASQPAKSADSGYSEKQRDKKAAKGGAKAAKGKKAKR